VISDFGTSTSPQPSATVVHRQQLQVWRAQRRARHRTNLVQQFRLGHRLPDLRATVGAFKGEVDLRHAPMWCDILDVHRQALTAWADHEEWFGLVMVDIGWHVGSPKRHSAIVPDPKSRIRLRGCHNYDL
jgi:hypothetical protein